MAVDQRARLRGKPGRHRIEDRPRAPGIVFGQIDFVKIESAGFPVFVQGEEQVGHRPRQQPRGVRRGFRTAACEVVAVQIDALGVLPGARRQPGGIERRADRPVAGAGEESVVEQLEQGERAGRFVAVHAGGQIDAPAGPRLLPCHHGAFGRGCDFRAVESRAPCRRSEDIGESRP